MTIRRTLPRLVGSLLTVLILGSIASAADIGVEVTSNASNTANLFSDSSNTSDSYMTDKATVSLYPLDRLRLEIKSEVSQYADIKSIDNHLLGAKFTWIPVSNQVWSLYSSLGYEVREYVSDSLNFSSTKDWDAMASAGNHLSPSTYLRFGVKYKHSEYTGAKEHKTHIAAITDYPGDTTYRADTTHYEEGPDPKSEAVVFCGANFTLGDGMALDVEAGVKVGRYNYVDSEKHLSDLVPPRVVQPIDHDAEYADSVVSTGTLKSVYIAPRFSFKIGRKTGVKLTCSYRSFLGIPDGAAVYGFSVPVLSPWASEYEGLALTLSAKSYVVPRIILSSGLGYFDKSFLDHVETFVAENPFTHELVSGVTLPTSMHERDDEQTRLYVAVQVPFASRDGWFIEPQFQIEFTKNKSSIVVYDYDNTVYTAGVTIRL